MKRIILVVFLFLVLVVAVAPYGIGVVIERQLHAQQQQIRDAYRPPFWMSIGLENYRRGWLSSSADMAVTVDFSRHPGFHEARQAFPEGFFGLSEPFSIVIHHDIRHGPLLLSPAARIAAARVESRLVLPEAFHEIVEPYFAGQPLLSGLSYVSLSGNSETVVTVPAWSGSPFEGLAFDWQGFNGTGRGRWFDIDGTFAGEAPLLELRAGDSRFVIRSMKLESEGRLSDLGFVTGASRLAIAEAGGMLTMPAAEPRIYAIEDMDVRVGMAIVGDLLEGFERISFARMTAGDFAAGPGEAQFDVRNLDTHALLDLIDEFDRMALEQGTPHTSDVPMSDRLRESVLALLKRSPLFEVSTARLVLPQGEVSGHLKVAFDGSAGIDIDAPERLAERVRVEGEFAVPAALSTQIAGDVMSRQIDLAVAAEGGAHAAPGAEELEQMALGMLADLERNGLLVREGDRHRVRFGLENGQGSLNGNPFFSLEDIFAAAAARRSGFQ